MYMIFAHFPFNLETHIQQLLQIELMKNTRCQRGRVKIKNSNRSQHTVDAARTIITFRQRQQWNEFNRVSLIHSHIRQLKSILTFIYLLICKTTTHRVVLNKNDQMIQLILILDISSIACVYMGYDDDRNNSIIRLSSVDKTNSNESIL